MGKVVSAVPKLITGGSGKSSAPPPPPPIDPAEEAAQKAKKAEESLAQRRRGRAGTITTSFRGLLDSGAHGLQRRTLLGD